MKTTALIVIGVSALALTGCVRPFSSRHQALAPVASLDCPRSQGRFQRTDVASDRKSCTYAGPDGAAVQLKLVSLSGDPDKTLEPMEAQMKAMLPPPPPSPPSPPGPPSRPGHDNVNIDLPGISIHADDKNANVQVAGVHVNADGDNSTVHVNGGHGPMGDRGQFTVDANDAGAVIRAQAFGPNVDQSLILASKAPGPQGWRTVGYEALGPKAGPLVVANFQSKADDHDTLFEDVKALVRKAAKG